MRKILIVVDMQNDFISMALGTKEAVNIVDNVVNKIISYPSNDIFVTMDTHRGNYLETQEGKMLPVKHCIRDTEGWKLHPSIEQVINHSNIYRKSTFSSLSLPIILRNIANKGDIEIEIIGLCTDICVISNALMIKAFIPEVKITVDASCCAGTTPEKHLAALEVMESCQINVVNKDCGMG